MTNDDIIRKFLDLHPDTPIDDKQYAVPLWVIRRMLETVEAAEREWVGLTDEDRWELVQKTPSFDEAVAAVEAKLKEKNA
jgi:hypothetical protein